MLYFENKAKRKGFSVVIGVDEAGRGPLAGPVVAAAVFPAQKKFKNKIIDSKLLSFAQREAAFEEIFKKAIIGVAAVSEQTIDRLNILRATHLAMSAAIRRLIDQFPLMERNQSYLEREICLLIDGNSFETELPFTKQLIVGGDRKSFSIACASIVAKVSRDRLMLAYHRRWPHYGFSHHKGYPTAGHREAIRKYGLLSIHRKTFQLSR